MRYEVETITIRGSQIWHRAQTGLRPPEMRAVLVALQRGACATCGASGRKLVVDHDHVTGLVRGLLCRSCNSTEGASVSRLLSTTLHELFAAYRANPPAACFCWPWDWPQRPQISNEDAIAALHALRLPGMADQEPEPEPVATPAPAVPAASSRRRYRRHGPPAHHS